MDEAAPLAEAAVTAPISLWRTVTSLAPAVKLAAESSAGTLAICLSAMWQARLSQISLKQRRWMRRRTRVAEAAPPASGWWGVALFWKQSEMPPLIGGRTTEPGVGQTTMWGHAGAAFGLTCGRAARL